MGNNLKIINPKELLENQVKYLNTEIQSYPTGHKKIDQFYKPILGNCTDITGYPYSGKTLLLEELTFNQSMQYGWKHLLHLPDEGKPEEYIAKYIQKKTGKTRDKRYSNVIEEHEMIKEMTWIAEHFKILKYDQRPTAEEFWEMSCEMDVGTACIDSWNYMKKKGSGVEYLADVLSYRNELAEKYNKHFYTVIHPKNPTAECYRNGILQPANQYNLMGGSEWNNNGKNIISVHKYEKESDLYDIHFLKIKPRIVGKTGWDSLCFDIVNQRFYENSLNGYRVYAFDETVINTIDEFLNLSPIPEDKPPILMLTNTGFYMDIIEGKKLINKGFSVLNYLKEVKAKAKGDGALRLELCIKLVSELISTYEYQWANSINREAESVLNESKVVQIESDKFLLEFENKKLKEENKRLEAQIKAML